MSAENALPIRRLTLYKHGVGFVERMGTVSGEQVLLTFRADEVNDALKSLLVIDRQGGQVLGMDYDTPADMEERLADSPITLSADHGLLDLLRSLRGWSVRLVGGDGSAAQTLAGRLIGVDLADASGSYTGAVVTLLDEAGAVVTVPLGSLRQLDLLEERASQDLRYVLDTSRGEDAHRTVTVRLSPGEHDLAVSYLVPSPTWRVSYRLVAEGTRAGQAEAAQETSAAGDTHAEPDEEGGTLLLQGWGLFDNRLEEDLDGVSVTLVAGQPISFIYDLASSHIPDRPVVEDEARVAAAPVEFAAALDVAQPAGMPAPLGAYAPAPMASPRMAQMAAVTMEEMSRQAVAAKGGGLGELFQYEVTAPVTVKRGASALVPVLSARLPYRRELLYNGAKLPDHPVAAFRFTNGSGLVLERGPVTVLDDGAYHGEAIVPFTKEQGEIYLAYSVELGITVTASTATGVETVGIHIAGALLQEKQAVTLRTSYRLENTLPAARTVTIEHPVWGDSELVETREPDARTAGFYRWRVPCPAREATSFVVAERRYTWQAQQLLDQSYQRLQQYLQHRWLDEATLARIRTVMEHRAAIARNDDETRRLQVERDDLYRREEGLRQNIAALGATGDEGALRKRAVGGLEACEDRLREIEARLATLVDERGRRQAAIDAQLATLQVDDTTAEDAE